jgi:pimeloyl-ACP methyl ester carboxylesterase
MSALREGRELPIILFRIMQAFYDRLLILQNESPTVPHLLRYRLKRWKRSALAKLALLSPRFSPLLGAPGPLRKIEYRSGTRADTLIIFLPGIDDLAEDFDRHGMINEMRSQGIGADAVAVDAHYGYYAAQVIHERITGDVIESAHAAGYGQVWLAGISLGGFGAASYAARYPHQVAGLLLFAPYLGSPALIREIAAAGGIPNWEPGHVAQEDYPRALWAWFKRSIMGESPAPRIYLGYGKRDMFARANGLLAEILPRDQVISIPGGHDWRTWKKLWQMQLAGWNGHRGAMGASTHDATPGKGFDSYW